MVARILQNEINSLLEEPDLEVEKIKANIFKLAAAKYTLSADTNHREQYLLEKLQYSKNVVDVKVLLELLENIQVSQNGISEMLMKGGMLIRKGGNYECKRA